MQSAPVRGPYCRTTIAMATMHFKERAVAKPFKRRLGAEIAVAPGIDTDSFGTFTGEVTRQGTMLDAARAKAQAAIEATGLPFGIGSEGSFGPHPFVPFVAAGTEVLLFTDRKRGIEIHEALVTHRTNYQSRACRPDEDLRDFLARARFPSHAIAVTSNTPATAQEIAKAIVSPAELVGAIRHAASTSKDGLALVVTDMRAHLNPTRMSVIRALSARLAARLATPCPACDTPGFGTVEIVRGLPCAWCGEPTQLAAAELRRCAKCGFERRSKIRTGVDAADPGQCEHCNP
jgi:hypothetical protein